MNEVKTGVFSGLYPNIRMSADDKVVLAVAETLRDLTCAIFGESLSENEYVDVSVFLDPGDTCPWINGQVQNVTRLDVYIRAKGATPAVVQKSHMAERSEVNRFLHERIGVKDVRVWSDLGRRHSVVSLDGGNRAPLYVAFSVLPQILPWITVKGGLSQAQLELLLQMSKAEDQYFDDYDGSVDCLKMYINQVPKLRSRIMRGKIQSVLEQFRVDRSSAIQERISTLQSVIDGLVEQLRHNEEDLQNAMIELSGIKILNQQESSEDEALLSFLEHDNDITVLDVSNGNLDLRVAGYVADWDPELCRAHVLNERSVLHDDFIADLCDAIFVKQTLKLRFLARFVINLEKRTVTTRKLDAASMADVGFGIPNPHIQRYGCMGTNRAEIEKCLKKGDLVMAIAQCKISAMNLNFADSAVLPDFLSGLRDTQKDCIELPDGTITTPMGAYNYLHKEDKS